MRLAPFERWVVFGLPMVISFIAISLPSAVGQGVFSRPSTERSATFNTAAPSDRGASATQPTRNGALFHGQEIRLPKMPFARSNSPAKGATNNSQVAANRNAPYAQNSPRVGGQANAATHQLPRQLNTAPSAVPFNPQRNSTPLAARPVQPSRQAALARPNNAAAQAPVANRSAERAPPREPTLAPAVETTRGTATPNRSLPESPADRLIAQAHDSSGSAESEADFTRIIEACRRASASQPNPTTERYANELASWAFNRRGQLEADAGRDEEAIRDFNDAVRADPERWRAIHNRGVLLAQSGEFERAFDDFNRTIQINPEFAKAYSNRAALFMVAGNLAPALQDYARAIELDPTLAVAHRGQGRACHLAGRSDEAIGHYDEAVRLAPGDAYAVASRADVLTDLGRYAEAAADYDRAITLDPKSSQAYSGSAWLLATCPDSEIRNPELAIERATTAVALASNDRAASFDTLAAAQANAGDFSAALATIRQAVQLATAEERAIYQQRLYLYQHAKPYRIAPAGKVMQASYEAVNTEQGAGSTRF